LSSGFEPSKATATCLLKIIFGLLGLWTRCR
jgi:hypothetical protein